MLLVNAPQKNVINIERHEFFTTLLNGDFSVAFFASNILKTGVSETFSLKYNAHRPKNPPKIKANRQ